MTWLVTLYLLAVALANLWAYRTFNRRWHYRERARITVGVLVVFLPVLPLAFTVLDPRPVAVLFAGFGVAGAITIFLDIQNETDGSDPLREEIINRRDPRY